jgi:hypothetical protein
VLDKLHSDRTPDGVPRCIEIGCSSLSVWAWLGSSLLTSFKFSHVDAFSHRPIHCRDAALTRIQMQQTSTPGCTPVIRHAETFGKPARECSNILAAYMALA